MSKRVRSSRAMQRAPNRGSQARKRRLRDSDFIVDPAQPGMTRSSLPLTPASFRYARALANRPPEILGANPFDKDPAWPRFEGLAEAPAELAQDSLDAYYEVSLLDLQSND